MRNTKYFFGLFVLLACVLLSPQNQCDAFSLAKFTKTATSKWTNVDRRQSLIISPPQVKNTSSTTSKSKETAIILLPGCQLRPKQYKNLAEQIQRHSEHPVWVAVPKLPLDVANPLAVPETFQQTLEALQDQGYQGNTAFIGGHSLGGVFVPNVFKKEDTQGEEASFSSGLRRDQVLGVINLGAFMARGTPEDSPMQSVPSLTITGELDGMVRTSRIAEDYHRHVQMPVESRAIPEEEAKLHHSVVLVEGMNHFGFVQGKAPLMKAVRDLPQEISHQESVQQVAKSISSFVSIHQPYSEPFAAYKKQKRLSSAKEYLLSKIRETEEYLHPLIEALKLEGSKHVGCDPSVGSVWATRLQEELLRKSNTASRVLHKDHTTMDVSNEFHASWYLNPFAKAPFYHPKVHACNTEDGNRILQMETMCDPIYEKTDALFDGGFFSNSVHELRCKFNSPQAVVEAATGKSVPFESPENFAKELNQRAIDWAMSQAPEKVRRRYQRSGIQLVLGDDVHHNNGPGWIWSYLSFDPKSQSVKHAAGDSKTRETGGNRRCREVRSHVMVTPTDHPVPAAGGKVYCKILSPAKVLDWMYTDSLRPETNPLGALAQHLCDPPQEHAMVFANKSN